MTVSGAPSSAPCQGAVSSPCHDRFSAKFRRFRIAHSPRPDRIPDTSARIGHGLRHHIERPGSFRRAHGRGDRRFFRRYTHCGPHHRPGVGRRLLPTSRCTASIMAKCGFLAEFNGSWRPMAATRRKRGRRSGRRTGASAAGHTHSYSTITQHSPLPDPLYSIQPGRSWRRPRAERRPLGYEGTDGGSAGERPTIRNQPGYDSGAAPPRSISRSCGRGEPPGYLPTVGEKPGGRDVAARVDDTPQR